MTAQTLRFNFDAPTTSGIFDPFAGTREGWVYGWLKSWQGRDHEPVPTLNRVADDVAFVYEAATFGLSPDVTCHVAEGGYKYLARDGACLGLMEAVNRGLAWEMKPK